MKRFVALLPLVFLIAAAPLEDMKGTLQPVAIGDAAGLFKKLCFDPFPESAKFTALIADPTLGFVKKPKTPSEAMQPGDIWYAPNASVTYSDADWLPRDLPSPQCTVTVALEGAPTHAEVASAVAAALALPAVKSSGSPARATSQWDMPGRGTDKFRLFLNTQALPSGSHEANLILLNLRGKKKND